jgi:trimeric autotransporter adhesin
LNITPAAGSAIVLDGTVNVDAGVITGATSITSTAFVGALTGNVTGNASGTAATVTTAAQTQITSLGTLTALTVDSIIVDGTNIGHTSDTDSIAIAADGVVTFSQIPVLPANSIDSDYYVDGSIDTAHIADDQITLAKMAGIARGKIIYGDASGNPAVLTAGSNGQVLSSDGTDISWAAASGGATDIDGLSDALTNSSGTTVGLGTGALASGGSTAYNTALGYEALNDATGASEYNVAVGYQAGHKLTTGIGNVAIGSNSSLPDATTGSHNVVIGSWAGYGVTTASKTIIIGNVAGGNITTADNSIFIGYYAGGAYWYAPSLTGQGNIGIGYYSSRFLTGATTGSVAMGPYSLEAVTTGSGNTGIGNGAGLSITTGTNNTCLGGSTSGPTTGSNNTILGYQATESTNTVSNEITLGNTAVTKFRIPGINFTVKDSTATEDYVLTVDSSGEAGWEAAGLVDDSVTLAKMAGIARGKIIYGDASGNPAVLTAGSNGQVLTSDGTDISWAAASGAAADDITAGDAAVLLTTSSGNITIDAAASDSDIIFKGTDGGVDTTFATMDGSAAGHLILNNGSSTTTLGTSNYIAGLNAGNAIISGGNYNTFISEDAGTATTTGDSNVAIGRSSLKANTTSSGNIAIGNDTLMGNTGALNVAIGDAALTSNTTGYRNNAIGRWAMLYNTTGAENVAFGMNALYSNTTASLSVAIGYQALTNATGGSNTALGHQAGDALTTGTNNTIIGNSADASAVGVSNEITMGNTAITKFRIPGINFVIKDTTATDNYVLTVDASGEAGWEAAAGGATDINGLSDAVTKSSGGTIGLGTGALVNDDGSVRNNTAVGYQAGNTLTDGYSNNLFGYQAGFDISSGYENIAVGYRSSYNVTTGYQNTGVGHETFYDLTTGYKNTAIGSDSSKSLTTGYNNVAMGFESLRQLSTGINNIAIGSDAGRSITTQSENVFLGASAGTAKVGTGNTLLGYLAGNTGATGNYNVYVGNLTGRNATGNNNTMMGYFAGYYQVAGTNNTIIGYNAAGSTTTISDEITLGNASIATLRCQVTTITALSDRRDKKDIEELPLGIDFINTLKPVKFTWNMRDGAKVGQQEAGFIAQDLDEAQIAAGAEDYLDIVLKNNPDKLEASMGKLVPVLVKAVQELSAEIAKLKKEIKNGK